MRYHLSNQALGGILFGVLALCMTAMPVAAQSVPKIENAAKTAAQEVAETHQRHVFILSHFTCQLDMELCTTFDASFRDDLEKLVPDVQFVKRDDIVSLLSKRGFIAPDINILDVLLPAAAEAGAEIVVTDIVTWRPDGYHFDGQIIDARSHKKLDQFTTVIERTLPDVGGAPLVVRDNDTGILQVISTGTSSQLMPHCDKCPEPRYTPAAQRNNVEGVVLLLATVTVRGRAEQISVVKGLPDGLTDQAIRTVRSWRFKPATAPDGKPAPMRVPIQLEFRLRR
jgi:TonB family protein